MAVSGRDYYDELSALPLTIDGYDVERLELDVSSGFTRRTTTVVLRGGGREGRGEDVTYLNEDHEVYPLDLSLGGPRTLDEFSSQIGAHDLFPARPPGMAAARDYRRWAFESAALDLALRQAGRSLGAALGLEYRPVRFVVSTRLDISPWLGVDPRLEFKLDPTPEWDAETMARIAAGGRVRALDFKAFYEGTPVDNAPDPVQYAAVARAFPDAILEDPVLEGPARRALDGQEARFSFDAPIHSWADVEAVAKAAGLQASPGPGGANGTDAGSLRRTRLPSHLNIKPSRFGSLHALFDCVARATAEGITLYGGGQFELGVGRDHIQALASLLYPDGPNDVAPRDFHGEPRAGVPRSPLLPSAQGPGFGFAFAR